ncbi:MAG: DUF2764 family protein [Bacteroidales bacterium]|nr:DUF2764 family protein [Bacteroidales bacterium]
MGNYEYIVSSLPALAIDWKFGEGTSFETYVSWIKSQLGNADIDTLDFLLSGYEESTLNKGFYETAFANPNQFIREFFRFDLNFRNAKARFLNKALGRPETMDTIDIPVGEFTEAGKLDEILSGTDLLAREKRLDSLVWDKINELTTFNYFDMDAILGFVARLHIIERWFSLDEETGRDMFIQLVEGLHDTAKSIKYVAPKE